MKILAGYDGSNAAKAVLQLAKDHAKIFGAKVYVVSSLPGGTESEAKDVEEAERELEYAKGVFDEASIESETHLLIRGLSAGEDIVNFIKENDIDEAIIGIRRRSKVGKLLFGSTAQFVILNADCPVVTIK